VTPLELERYLHEHIPLSRAMQVSVVSVQPESVVLSAPLAPNINHRELGVSDEWVRGELWDVVALWIW